MNNNFYASKSDSVDHILLLLKRFGVVRLPKYLSPPDSVSALRTEALALLEGKKDFVKPLSYRPKWDSKAVSVDRSRLDEQAFPHTARVFGSEYMHSICDEYLDLPNDFNNAIYITHDLPNPKTVTLLHYDRIYALKFYIYLFDTSKDNGAFEIILGSQVHGRNARHKYLKKGYLEKDIPIKDFPPNLPLAVPIESDAGTLIIFDTDTIHRGGVVLPGKERLIMRAHSHTIPRDYCP